jgi:hypothetical protein
MPKETMCQEVLKKKYFKKAKAQECAFLASLKAQVWFW